MGKEGGGEKGPVKSRGGLAGDEGRWSVLQRDMKSEIGNRNEKWEKPLVEDQCQRQWQELNWYSWAGSDTVSELSEL